MAATQAATGVESVRVGARANAAETAERAEGRLACTGDRPTAVRTGSPALLRALVVDGEGPRRDAAVGRLSAGGFEVCACRDTGEAFAAFLRELPDLVVLARDAREVESGELLRRLREISEVPVVLFGGARTARGGMGVPDDRAEACVEVEDLAVAAIDAVATQRNAMARVQPMTADRVRQAVRLALRSELQRQLVACRGNLAEIARRMGKDRSTIRYHLRRFGMLVEEGGANRR